jgi:hypothetical protein
VADAHLTLDTSEFKRIADLDSAGMREEAPWLFTVPEGVNELALLLTVTVTFDWPSHKWRFFFKRNGVDSKVFERRPDQLTTYEDWVEALGQVKSAREDRYAKDA